MTIKEVSDVVGLLKDLSTYSGLSTRYTADCREAVRVMEKAIAIGPGGAATLKSHGVALAPVASAPAVKLASGGKWNYSNDVVGRFKDIVGWCQNMSPACNDFEIIGLHAASGGVEIIYRYR